MNKRTSYISKLIATITIIVVSLSCENGKHQYFPESDFHLRVDLNVYNSLKVGGNSEVFEDYGVAGIVVYCESYTPSGAVYHAYDMACPYEIGEAGYLPDSICTFNTDEIQLSVVCECCASEYSIWDGYGAPLEGVSNYFLKSYGTYTDGDYLHIYN